jgi:hypothetical protein
MDADLLALIREIAELPTSCETPGVALDFELDNLVFTARSLVRREERRAANDDERTSGTYGKIWL